MAGRRGIVKFDTVEMADGTKYQIKVSKSDGTFYAPDPRDDPPPGVEIGNAEYALQGKDLEELKGQIEKYHQEKVNAQYQLFIEISGYSQKRYLAKGMREVRLDKFSFRARWIYLNHETRTKLDGQADFLAPGKDPDETFAWESEPSGPDDRVRRCGGYKSIWREDEEPFDARTIPYSWERWYALTQIKAALEEIKNRLEGLLTHDNLAQLLHEGTLPLMLAGEVEPTPDPEDA